MRITVTSVFVDDQHKALRFYTEVVGFEKKREIPLGEARWLTVVAPDQPDGTELLLEPDGHLAVRPFKDALVADGIPYTSFGVEDVAGEVERLKARALHAGAAGHGRRDDRRCSTTHAETCCRSPRPEEGTPGTPVASRRWSGSCSATICRCCEPSRPSR